MDRNNRVQVFSSFEDENLAEYQRCARMTPEERLREFDILQQRRWGIHWTSQPMVKTVSYEQVSWWDK